MLEIKNIEVVYNEVVLVIKGLSLIVKEGEHIAQHRILVGRQSLVGSKAKEEGNDG